MEEKLRELKRKREILKSNLCDIEEEIKDTLEIIKLQASIDQQKKELEELCLPKDVKKQKLKKQAEEKRTQAEQKKLTNTQPSYWPFPSPTMTKQEQSDWLDDHNL